MRLSKSSITLFSLLASSCIPESRADTPVAATVGPDSTANVNAGYEARLAARTLAHEANVSAGALAGAPGLAVANPCADDEVHWQRDKGTAFCALMCTSDDECGKGERCRIVDDVGQGRFEDVFAGEEKAQGASGLCDPWHEPEVVVKEANGVDAGM